MVQGQRSPGSVTSITASLFCGADTVPAMTTRLARLSSTGNARLDAEVDLPTDCLAPVVVVHPNGVASQYIAASGFRRLTGSHSDAGSGHALFL